MTHSNSLSASKSADLADDLASTAAYVRARHGSAYGLTAANVSDRRIGVLTLTVPADDALCCLGCCDQVDARDLAIHVLGTMGWTVLDHGMATFTPPIYHPQDPNQAARVEEVEKLLN